MSNETPPLLDLRNATVMRGNNVALDIGGQLELSRTLSESANAGLGIVLVMHHVPKIIPEIERGVLLQKERVLADGPKEKVLTSVHLPALFGAHDRVFREDGYSRVHA
jgi:iron complex transport system ATP-binding protein